ncbi:WxL domain-containing protein [Lactococcus sp.]|uniref:WxL domain-containing protein n=1 Tax=Lactococcus sp. TaxID=44273 RepID=UPI0035B35D97
MTKKQLLYLPLILISIGITDKIYASTTQNYNSKGSVGFKQEDKGQLPVDPNLPNPLLPVSPQNPDGSTPNPGGIGTLTIDFASSLDFGNHSISNKDQVYFAKAQKYFDSKDVTPNYVQVTDRRGTFSGWSLSVVENIQFTQVESGPQKYKELNGATISFNNSIADSNTAEKSPNTTNSISLVPGVSTQIALAEVGSGAGTWVIRWGNQSSITEGGLNPDVSLFVPGTTPKDAADYTTTLSWILSDLPTNS